ncbi:MAG: EamA/RhaT family transporter [Bacteroidia bacterium]|nr:EamA/RhaT family transporter [Bacteroidia bacterium]NNJ56521.1 EamA/RhaT family transporter [Bacteroidia bacterium]
MAIVYLILSITFSTLINLVFRWFKEHDINKLQAIIVNYLVCFIVGFSLSKEQNLLEHFSAAWFHYCLVLGFLFVAIFYAMALTTEKIGISVNAVSSKMAVVVPVLFAYFFANEDVNLLFAGGILISLLSIYFISIKKHIEIPRKYYLLPVVVFLGSGIIDTSLKAMESNFGNVVSLSTISYSIFLGAGIAGSFLYLIKKGVKLFKTKNIVAGVALGVPNYFSIYFLLSAIAAFKLKSAFVFGINNISIVLLSTLLSLIIFKEHLSFKNKLGLVLAIFSILIISYAS